MKENLVCRGKEEQRRKRKTLFGEGKVRGGRYLEKEIIGFANIRTKMVYEKHRYR